MKTTAKKIFATGLAASTILATTLTASEINFVNYDSSNGYKSVYVNDPLGCSYTNNLERKVNNYGKDWEMESAVTSHGEDYKGEYILNGYTKLTSNSCITGFTGATLINVKDANNNEMYLASVKTKQPVATTSVSTDQAEQISWGVGAGKFQLYIAGYKYKKIAWWKVKIPIIKSRVKAKTRTLNWSIALPKYVLDRDIKVELVNVHTPTRRVLAALKDSGKYATSFVLANGVQTKALYDKAQAGSLTYGDVESYINSVLAWAEVQQMITPGKSQNITNIMAAVHEIINNGAEGFQPENHDDLVAIAFNITSIVSEKNINPASLNALIDSIEDLCLNKGGFVPANLEPIETILVNVKGLVGEHLSADLQLVYDDMVGVVAAINDWNEIAIYEHQAVVFDGMRLIVDLSAKVSNKTITAAEAETMLNAWFEDVSDVIAAENPGYAATFDSFRYNILGKMFDILIALENSNWI